MPKEDDDVSGAPAPITLDNLFIPGTFSAWAVQGHTNPSYIQTFYTYLDYAMDYNYGRLLHDIVLAENRGVVAFSLYVDTRTGSLSPHIVPFQSLGVGPCFTNKDEGDTHTPIYIYICLGFRYYQREGDPLHVIRGDMDGGIRR